MLLELNDPTAALKEYELSVRTDRNRFRSILGIARTAKQSGNTPTAYEKLVTLANADSDRLELAEASPFFGELKSLSRRLSPGAERGELG